MSTIRCFFLIFWFCFLENGTRAQTDGTSKRQVPASDTFPVPPENKNMLFYVQRTHNKNTIVYELNYNSDSTINETNPVKIYWIRYSDKGEIVPLSYVQNKYAYGIVSMLTSAEKKSFKLNFVSYKARDIHLMKSGTDRSYHAVMVINGKLAYLRKVFVQIEGGTFWVPHIVSVEITGKEIATGESIIEKFKP